MAALSPPNGKEEQLESELSKKLEIAEDGQEENDGEEGSKGELID
jgi:methionyl aminopeptidase